MIWWRKHKTVGALVWQATTKYHVAKKLRRHWDDCDGVEGLDCMAEQLIAEEEGWA